MRHLHLGQTFEVVKPSGIKRIVPEFDLGIGLEFEVDTAELQPKVGGCTIPSLQPPLRA